MIANITRGNRVRGLAAYLHGRGHANEHTHGGRPGGAVIGGNLGVDGDRDGRGWASDMQTVIDQRRDVSRPVWHMSLRLAPDDRALSEQEWRDAVQEIGERMGWAEHPHVIVKHADDHVHVAVSRVGYDGQLWHGRHDRRQAQQARQAVERRLGLTAAPVDKTTSTATRLTRGEYAAGLRTGDVPDKERLRNAVASAVEASKGLGRAGFEQALDGLGVLHRANVASTGRVSGYSFALPADEGEPVWHKASGLSRGLAWSKVEPQLAANLPEPKTEAPARRLFESRRKHTQRVDEVQAAARQQDRSTRRRAAVGNAQQTRSRQDVASRSTWKRRSAASPRTWLPRARRHAEAFGRPATVSPPRAAARTASRPRRSVRRAPRRGPGLSR